MLSIVSTEAHDAVQLSDKFRKLGCIKLYSLMISKVYRQGEYSIDLQPGMQSIFMTPYQMAVKALEELKIQLQNYLNKWLYTIVWLLTVHQFSSSENRIEL